MQPISIVPSPLLSHVANQEFQMCLYQEAKKDPIYAQFYKEQIAAGKFVLLDNGAAEGVNPTWQELVPIYEELGPSEIILPDVVGEKEETLKRSSEAYIELKGLGFHNKMQFMGVPQGRTFSEWLDCLRVMMIQDHITTIGVSKFVTKLFAEELGATTNVRLECVDAILNHPSRKKVQIHLLGCYYTPYEIQEIEAAFPGKVRSTDSAIAYVYARNSLSINTATRPDQKEIDFQQNDIPEYDTTGKDLLDRNIELYSKICRNL